MKTKHHKMMKTYISEDEYALISKAAYSTNLSISKYIRQTCLGYKVTSKVDIECFLSLIKIKNDFNRLGNLLKQHVYKNTHDYKDAQQLYKSIVTAKENLETQIKIITTQMQG